MIAANPKMFDDLASQISATSQTTPQNKRPLNICIASPEFIGLARQCKTGVAYTALAQSLAVAGHQVTCLFLGAKDLSVRPWQEWVEKYRRDGLTLIALPQINASELVAPSHLIKSYETYHWLKRNDRFDIIHFPDRHGPGYHTLTAKHYGLAFAQTTICVDLHSMSAWVKAVDQGYTTDLTEADTEFMERRTVALADAVVSPSHYLVDWISEQKWESAENDAQQNPLPRPAQAPEPIAMADVCNINELIFFGALETQEGIAIFCDALDLIPPEIAKKIEAVTFLGRESIVEGIPARNYVKKRAKHWPFPFKAITGQDTNQTMDYLRGKNRLAVIPALLEKSPHRVLECLVARIAFVAGRVGGIPELIESTDAASVCFEPNASALCAILCSALDHGVRPARPGIDTRGNDKARYSLHENSLPQPQLA
jgi:hypothetical protein